MIIFIIVFFINLFTQSFFHSSYIITIQDFGVIVTRLFKIDLSKEREAVKRN